MNPRVILSGLEEIAVRLGLKVRYEKLGDDEFEVKSGRFRLQGEDVILLDRRLDVKARIEVISRELARLDLTGIYIKPFLRGFLEDRDVDS